MKPFGDAYVDRKPLLSVVCATRNAAGCIEGLLDSYRRERSADTELVVIDGASTDATWGILDRHREVVDFAFTETDAGIYDAWNKALPRCRGNYVAFIGADDRLARGSLGALVAACREDAGYAHIVGGFNLLTRDGVPAALLGKPFDRARLHRLMMIAHVMSAHRLDWLRSVGGFDASFRSSGDYELQLRERATLRVRIINEILALTEDGGISRRGLRPFTENFRARRMNGYSACLCTALFARAMCGLALRRLRLR